MSGRVCTQMRLRIFMGIKSHKEGPTGGGRIPYGLASGNKKYTVPISAKNLIRRDPPEVGGFLMGLRPVIKNIRYQYQRKIS